MKHMNNNAAGNREIVIERLLNAPRELVYEAWTDPRHIINWWGPAGFTNTFSQMIVAPGGVWEFVMHGPDGTDHPNRVVFKEVVKPERLVYVHSSGIEHDPNEFVATITFESRGDKTLLTMSALFTSANARDMAVRKVGAIEGGNQTIDRLEAHLDSMTALVPSAKEVIINRLFNASREMVFEAWTDQQLVSQWWGPQGFSNPVVEWNARPGGSIRIEMKAPDGIVYPMKGTFISVNAPDRLTFVSTAYDQNNNRLFEVVTDVVFTEQNGVTRLSMTATVYNAAAGAERYTGGMIAGWNQSLDKLAKELRAEQLTGKNSRELVIGRVLDAPVELVFKAWSDPAFLSKWWGPKGFEISHFKLDFRAGGTLHYCMSNDTGFGMWGKFVYVEIVQPGLIVFINSFSDKGGNTVRAPFNALWPLEVQNVLTLTPYGTQTMLTLRGAPINASEEERTLFAQGFGSMQQGFNGTFEQLAAQLELMKLQPVAQ